MQEDTASFCFFALFYHLRWKQVCALPSGVSGSSCRRSFCCSLVHFVWIICSLSELDVSVEEFSFMSLCGRIGMKRGTSLWIHLLISLSSFLSFLITPRLKRGSLMNYGGNRDLCSASSDLLWLFCWSDERFWSNPHRSPSDPETQKASDRLSYTQFNTLIPKMTTFTSKKEAKASETTEGKLFYLSCHGDNQEL